MPPLGMWPTEDIGVRRFAAGESVQCPGREALTLRSAMKVGVPKESAAGERRVALVPDSVRRLQEAGVDVLVERAAGEAAGFLDHAYEEAGAQVVDDVFREADLIAKVQKPSEKEMGRLREGQTLVTFLQPLTSPELVRSLADKRVTAFSMDSIPRTTRPSFSRPRSWESSFRC